MIKICLNCKTEFEDKKHKNKIFCCFSCYKEYYNKKNILFCDYCGKEIKRFLSQRIKTNKHYCSSKCYHLSREQKNDVFYEDDYAYILLTKNNLTKKVLFDIEDVDKIREHKWHLHYREKDKRYDACTNVRISLTKRKYINMPRYILNYFSELSIDHINHDTLDNRKQNLRICTIFENNLNKSNNKSGCAGVCWDKNRKKWHVMFKSKNLGRFNSYEQAVEVRKNAEKNYHLQNKV